MNDSDIWVILIKDTVAIDIHKMFTIQTDNHTLKPALLVIDVQNGFVSEGGSYDRLEMDTSSYRSVIPKIQQLVNLCREVGIPIFYTEATREPSGVIVVSYERAGEVKTGSFGLETPSVAELARRKRLKEEG